MKVNLQFLANPYMAFSLIWTVGILLYLLGWSDVFPALSIGLLSFVLINVVLSVAISIWLVNIKYFRYKKATKFINMKNMVVFNAILWIINFIYSRIPLLEILTGTNFGYTDFGIPVVIVFITCFNSFLCVYSFHCYLSTKNKVYIIYYLICIGLFVLAYSRGLIMFTLVSSLFLWIAAKGNTISFKQTFVILSMIILVFYVFGYAGNIRTAQAIATENNQQSYTYNNELILEIGSASSDFTKSIIPNEFFWTYLYIASPISNLQYNMDKPHVQPYTFRDFVVLIVNETWYETVSKRIGEYYPKLQRTEPDLVSSNLNVSTAFTRAYMNLGYIGLCIMSMHLLILPIIYIKIIGLKSQYLPVAIAIMCSIYFFSIFDNMFAFVGSGPQLLFPLLFEYLGRVKFKKY